MSSDDNIGDGKRQLSEQQRRQLEEEGDEHRKRTKRDDATAESESESLRWSDAWTLGTSAALMFDRLSDAKQASVKRFLLDNGVATLGELKTKVNESVVFCLTFPIKLTDDQISTMIEWLEDLGKATLGGRILSIVSHSEASPLHDDMFKEILETIGSSRSGARNARNGHYPPILVAGSSGAGKTTFAKDILRKELFLEDSSMFAVFLDRRDLVHDSKSKVERDGKKWEELEAEDKKASTICKRISTLLSEIGLSANDKEFPLKQHELLLVIDELGLDEDREWLGSTCKLAKIRTSLEKKIASKVQLVLVGTGLDIITRSYNTNVDAVIVAVQPWTIDQVSKLANAMNLREEFSKLIKGEEILVSLGTNARAATYMIRALNEYDKRFPLFSDYEALIDRVVTDVAFQYIDSIGLSNCDPSQRRHVAKVVLTAVRGVAKNETSCPTISDGTDPNVKKVAIGLMDFHLEKHDSSLRLRNGASFAVTMSPAVAIVLTAIMGAVDMFSSSWEGVERMGALDALGSLFVDSQVPVPEMSIVRAGCPFPATDATEFYKAPAVIKGTMVFLNGTGAPHADIISCYRFGQVKRTTNELANLDIQVELGKMGLMKNDWYIEEKKKKEKGAKKKAKSTATAGKEEDQLDDYYLASRWMTRILLKYWNDPDVKTESLHSAAATAREDSAAMASAWADGSKRHMYPFNQLHRRGNRSAIHVDCIKVEINEDSKTFARKPIDELIPADKMITVVFATNSAGFKLAGEQGLDIRRCDVDNDGVLVDRSHADALFGQHLGGSKVQVRFQIPR